MRIVDNSNEVLTALESQIATGLEAVGFAAEGHASLLCPVDTGRLRSSITHVVDDHSVIIGTDVEYAIDVEFNESARHENGQAHFLRDGVAGHISEFRDILYNALKS